MNKFEIRITNVNDSNDFSTTDAYAEDLSTIDAIIEEALEIKAEVAFDYGDNYIVITEYSEGGYYYHIYESKQDYLDDKEDIDGGLCTTTLSNAIGMALNN